jgi:hypothetical protein
MRWPERFFGSLRPASDWDCARSGRDTVASPKDEEMLIHPYPRSKPGPLKAVGILLWLGGILALLAEAAIMVALMVMAGICALGSIIWWLIRKGTPVPGQTFNNHARSGMMEVI